MVNFFNPGGNREFFGNRAKWNPAKTTGVYYGGPSQVAGSGLAAPLSPPQQGGPGLGGPLPPFGGGMERGVDPGANPFQPRPPVQYNLPGSGQGNGIPGMGQNPGGGVGSLNPGMGVGVSADPFTPDPNNITRNSGSIGGNPFAGGGMRRWGNRPLLANPNMRGL